jgi:hypothetical protein
MTDHKPQAVASNALLESAIWRANGFEAQVDIVRGHKACNEVLLVRGSFGECWAPIDEIYPCCWREINSNPTVDPRPNGKGENE